MTPPRPENPSSAGSYSNAWRNFTRVLLPPVIRSMLRLEGRGLENLRGKDGVILAVNHLSYMDILALGLFVHRAGRYPVFLAKSSLFEIPVFGPLLRKLGQLPVYRGQVDAALVLKDAERLGLEGACVIFYPESTVTRDPDMWPMVAKTGVARLALTADIPVVPVAEWGAQWILPYGDKVPRIFPHKPVQVLAGPPVDLSEFKGQPLTNQVLRAATDKIMADVAALVGELRGEVPPAKPFHPAIERRKVRQELRSLQQASEPQAAAGEGQAADHPPAADGAPAADAAQVADASAPEADSP
jgi:1-acyl-sn-glycerol-3-phosphate acyltransferase